MSQINTNAILDASGGTSTTVNGYTPTASNMAGRNRIINGAMMIDQRNAGASVALSGSAAFSVDRWKLYGLASGGASTATQSTTAPAGFSHSLLYSVTTGSTITGGDYAGINHYVEGLTVADWNWGTSDAKTVTLSFDVRSSVTGTYAVCIQNSGASRSYVAQYTVNSANTWEQKTITIPGDTTGTWLITNGVGALVSFDMGFGYGNATAANTWEAGDKHAISGNVKLAATTGATFYITGVQLEEGSVATPFEHRSYGQELALCQRYYWQAGASGYHMYIRGLSSFSASCGLSLNHPVQMRASPTANGITGANVTGLAVGASDSTGAIIVGAASAAGSTASILTLSFGAEL